MSNPGPGTGDAQLYQRARKMDRITAEVFDRAGDAASGLDLSEAGEDGHAVANLLWKIAAHLRARGAQ